MGNDLRYAVRRLRHSPGTAAVIVLTLAVGIGVNVALSAIADAVMFRPLPFVDQQQLAIGGESEAAPRSEISYANFSDWQRRNRTFTGVAAIGSSNWTAPFGAASPIAVPYRAVSWNFFEVLGVRAALGRTFDARDDHPSAPGRVVIGHGFWQRQFGGDPRVVGRPIVFNHRPFTIVGVMARDFTYPAGADAWVPLVPEIAGIHGPGLPDFLTNRGAGLLYAIGRRRPGVTLESARADLDRIVREIQVENGRRTNVSARLTPLVDDLTGSARVHLWALLGAVVLLLVAAGANVAGLTLVQTARRQREIATRIALGATRAALARQLVSESVILTAVAVAIGVAMARVCLPAVVALAPSDIPRLAEATIDLRVLAYAVLIGLATSAFCALAPALHVRRASFETALKSAGRAVASGGFTRARRVLVTLEVAVAVLILTATGLLVQSVVRLGELDLGFAPGRLLAARIAPPADVEESHAAAVEFWTRAMDAVASVASVAAVAGVSQRPLEGPIGLDSSWTIEGQRPDVADRNPWVNTETITASYFQAMGTRLLQGRAFTDDDRETTEPVVIVNHRLAAWAWPVESAIGKRIRVAALRGARSPDTWWTVVGVAADIRYRDIASVPLDVYVPLRQSAFGTGWLMLRTRVPAAEAAAEVRARLQPLNPRGVVEMTTMEQEVRAYQAPWKANLVFFGFFAFVTVLLAIVGLYTMLSATVVEQSRAIGVRLALGATPRRVVRDVIARGVAVVIAGAIAGILASIAAARVVSSLLFEVTPLDPFTLTAAPAVLAALAVAACALPAMRAGRIDPAIALRAE